MPTNPESKKAGTLTAEKDMCGHCLEDRRLVYPDAFLCIFCDAKKKSQDRASKGGK